MSLLKYLLVYGGVVLIATAVGVVAWDIYWRFIRRPKQVDVGAESAAPAKSIRCRMPAVLALLGCVCFLTQSSIALVPSGMAGVRVSELSGTLPGTLYPGTHLVWPLVHRVELFNIRDQVYSAGSQCEKRPDPLQVQTREGLAVGLGITVRYRLDPGRLDYVHANLPQPVEQEIVLPVVTSAFREVVPNYLVRDVFATKREEVRKNAAATIVRKLAADAILVKEVMLRDIVLPPQYAQGMEALLVMEQENDRMELEIEVKQKLVRTAELEAEAAKAREVKKAEGAAQVAVLQAKSQSDAMQYTLPLKEKQIQQSRLEAEAKKESTIKNAEAERWVLTVRNLSSLSEIDVRVVEQVLDAELRGRLMTHDSKSTPPTALRVTLSENAVSHMLIAQTWTDGAPRTYVTEWPRTPRATSPDAPSRFTLHLRPLFRQQYPILDLVPLGERLLVLDPTNVSLYKRNEGSWEIGQLLPLPQSTPWPRDPRGRLIVEGSSFRVDLPGQYCAGTIDPSLRMDCTAGDVDWPLDVGAARLTPGRNFFEHQQLPPFFSGARANAGDQSYSVFAGQDGTARLFDSTLTQVASYRGWGGDIAGIKTPCGCGQQVIVTLPGGAGGRDALQAFEISDLRAVPVTSPAELPGVVTALWPSATGDTAIVVAVDAETGSYEAFLLSIDCGR